jgi:hypothetical protein
MSKEIFSFESQYREVNKPAIAPLQTNHTLERGQLFLELITQISTNERAIALSIVNQFELYDYNDYKTAQDGVRRHVYCHSVRYLQESGETWQYVVEAPKIPKGYRYLSPAKIGNRAFLPDIPKDIRKAISKRYGVKVPLDGSFWEWFEKNKQIPLEITEGCGKGLSGLSHSFVAIALYGCSCLGSLDLLPFLKGRDIRIALDCDTKPSAIRAVRQALFKHLKRLSKLAKSVKVVTWDSKTKGLDDLLASGGAGAYLKAIKNAKSADDWLFEQNLVIARQRLEISDRLTHDIEITHDKFRNLDFDSLMKLTGNARDIALNAFTGAGKTELAAKVIANFLYAIAPFHRRSLAQSGSVRLGLTYRTDCDIAGNDLINSEGYVNKLGLCNESVLGMLRAIDGLLNKGAIALGDEFDQQLENLALSSTHSKDGRRRIHTDTFWKIFTRAIQTLIASADITDYEINQFHKMTGRKPFVIKVKPVKKTYRAFVYQQLADFWQKFNEARSQGKRILILCTRKSDAEFLKFAYGAVAVHADNANEYREFLDIPNPWLESEKPSLMAVSPVLGTGFSITQDAFDCVFGWFHADNIPAKGLMQFLDRYRLPCDRHIYCDYSSNRFEGLTPDELYKTRLAKARANRVIAGEESYISPDDPWFHYQAATNWSLAHLRADLFARLERDVETVEYVRSTLSPDERKTITRELNQKLREYRATYSVNVFAARNLSLPEYLEKKDRQDLSESDRIAVTKFEIADWSCLTPDKLTLEKIQRDRKGKKRTQSERIEMQVFPEISKVKDKTSYEKQAKHGAGYSQQDFSHNNERVRALEKLDIKNALDYALIGGVWNENTPEIMAAAASIKIHNQALKKMGIRLQVSNDATNNRIFGGLLEYFGVKRKRSQPIINGVKTSCYQVHPDDLALTIQDLIARLPRNIEWYGELTFDSQNPFVKHLYTGHTPFDNNKYIKVCDQSQSIVERAVQTAKTKTDPPDIKPPIAEPKNEAVTNTTLFTEPIEVLAPQVDIKNTAVAFNEISDENIKWDDAAIAPHHLTTKMTAAEQSVADTVTNAIVPEIAIKNRSTPIQWKVGMTAMYQGFDWLIATIGTATAKIVRGRFELWVDIPDLEVCLD